MASPLYLPAEWEPQSCIQLTWPDGHTDWAPYLDAITKTFIELAQAITRYERLIIAAADADAVRSLLDKVLDPNQRSRVKVYPCPINDTWARDHAPLTLTSHDDGLPSKRPRHRLLNFRFNGWGEKFDWQKDNQISANLYRQDAYNGELEDHDDFVLEGGSVESDGKGTVFTTACCLLAPHRNQPLTEAGITERLKLWLHADRIVWLHHGQLRGDDTDGHIDTIVRTCPNDTLAYVSCEDPEDEQYADFKALEEELKTLTTLDGRPYRLLPLPMPRRMEDDGYRLPATYANFVILNGAVLVPTYQQPDNDEQAKAVIAKAFPDRVIIGIDASTVVRQHGSLHCLTMQFPAD